MRHQPTSPPTPKAPIPQPPQPPRHRFEAGDRYWSSLPPGSARHAFWFAPNQGFWQAVRQPGGVGFILHMLYFRSFVPAWHRFTTILSLALFAALTYLYFFGGNGGTKP